jgi:hypothetical protein
MKSQDGSWRLTYIKEPIFINSDYISKDLLIHACTKDWILDWIAFISTTALHYLLQINSSILGRNVSSLVVYDLQLFQCFLT